MLEYCGFWRREGEGVGEEEVEERGRWKDSGRNKSLCAEYRAVGCQDSMIFEKPDTCCLELFVFTRLGEESVNKAGTEGTEREQHCGAVWG